MIPISFSKRNRKSNDEDPLTWNVVTNQHQLVYGIKENTCCPQHDVAQDNRFMIISKRLARSISSYDAGYNKRRGGEHEKKFAYHPRDRVSRAVESNTGVDGSEKPRPLLRLCRRLGNLRSCPCPMAGQLPRPLRGGRRLHGQGQGPHLGQWPGERGVCEAGGQHRRCALSSVPPRTACSKNGWWYPSTSRSSRPPGEDSGSRMATPSPPQAPSA